MIKSILLTVGVSLLAFICSKDSGAEMGESKGTETDTVDKPVAVTQWHWDGIREVRAFQINSDEPTSLEGILSRERLDRGGVFKDRIFLNASRSPEAGVKLTNTQINKLHTCVYSAMAENCVNVEVADWKHFYPSHAFLFYDRDGQVIGGVDFCLKHSSYSGWPTGFLTG